MPPFNNFTTKAKEAIRRAHELAVERGQSHVNPMHLLASLVMQEESLIATILERLEVDSIFLTDSIVESLDSVAPSSTVSSSYQLYLTPDLAQIIDSSLKIAQELKDNFITTEHLFIAILNTSCSANDLLKRFKIEKEAVIKIFNRRKEAVITKVLKRADRILV